MGLYARQDVPAAGGDLGLIGHGHERLGGQKFQHLNPVRHLLLCQEPSDRLLSGAHTRQDGRLDVRVTLQALAERQPQTAPVEPGRDGRILQAGRQQACQHR